MRRYGWAAVLAVACGAAGFAQPPAKSVAAEMAKFNGFWKPDSVVIDGTEQFRTPADKAGIVLRIKDGEYTLFEITDAKKDEGHRLVTAKLAVDPTAKTFEMTVTDGYKKSQRLHGVYEQNGTQLRLCYCPAEKPRPTKLEAPKGTGPDTFCETWVHEKK